MHLYKLAYVQPTCLGVLPPRPPSHPYYDDYEDEDRGEDGDEDL